MAFDVGSEERMGVEEEANGLIPQEIRSTFWMLVSKIQGFGTELKFFDAA